MFRYLVAAVAVSLLPVSGAALAESRPYQGTVQSVDPQSDTVTFEDGTTFRAGEGVEIDGLDPGTKVTFYYHTYDGQKTVVSYAYADSGEVDPVGAGEVDGASPQSILPSAGD